ncbi:MAG: CorA family divalent cation transporter [bacterium]|nr:CorA family divalent cation transporter [bacterium]
MKIIKNKNITWIDIAKPTKQDIEFVAKQHKFHPIILDELLHVSAHSRVDIYDQYLYLTYHIPVYDPVMKTSRKAEIDCLITKNKIITVHYEELEPINNFTRNLTNNPHFKETAMENTGKLLYSIIEEIINFSMRQLKHIEENVTGLTQELFTGKEEAMLRKISYVKRDLLDYRIISRPQEILLKSLKETSIKFWGEGIVVYLSDLVGDHLKVTQHLENYQQTIESLEETNAQLLNAKTNSVMQKFNILAFLTIPMVVVIQLFSVDSFNSLLGENNLKLFLASIITVISITTISLMVFKNKKWL